MSDSLDDTVCEIVDEALPAQEIAGVNPAGPSWNDRNETVAVEFADGDNVFCKVAVDGDGARIARERAAIAYAGEHCDITVPSVVATETDRESPFLLTAPIDCQNLADGWSEYDSDQRRAVVRQFGGALAELHAQRFERHGQIAEGDADGLTLEMGSWTEVLLGQIDVIEHVASTDRFPDHFEEVRAAVRANSDLLNEAPATLVHGDPARPNCFQCANGIGLVDWEATHVGDPVRELHRAQDQLLPEEAPELQTALHAGYSERTGSLPPGMETRTPVYDAVRFLGTSGFFDKNVELREHPPAEFTTWEAFATWVDEEMCRRLDEIR